MPNPTAKPLALIKGHRTRAEIETRQSAEQALYTGEQFSEEQATKDNAVAHKEFLRLKRLFTKIPFVDALDQGVINRYCQEVANLDEIQKNIKEMQDFVGEIDDYEQKIKTFAEIGKLISAAHKSKELLIKYDNCLFLSPAARIKAIPKQPEKQEEASGIAGFKRRHTQ